MALRICKEQSINNWLITSEVRLGHSVLNEHYLHPPPHISNHGTPLKQIQSQEEIIINIVSAKQNTPKLVLVCKPNFLQEKNCIWNEACKEMYTTVKEMMLQLRT